MVIRIGIAGWSFPKSADQFPQKGTHLERYASQFNALEINSSFYRPHRRATYERWSACTPANFKFAVKMPKQITHANRLIDVDQLIEAFIDQITGLGNKLGPVLIQLPPSLSWDEHQTGSFFERLRTHYTGDTVCEPRHRSWFEEEVDGQLETFHIRRVLADPSPVSTTKRSAKDNSPLYFRLHGSPRIYYSSYDHDYIHSLAKRLSKPHHFESWCIFDNTAENAAINNAFELKSLLPSDPSIVLQ